MLDPGFVFKDFDARIFFVLNRIQKYFTDATGTATLISKHFSCKQCFGAGRFLIGSGSSSYKNHAFNYSKTFFATYRYLLHY